MPLDIATIFGLNLERTMYHYGGVAGIPLQSQFFCQNFEPTLYDSRWIAAVTTFFQYQEQFYYWNSVRTLQH